jgi:hypothetical protein
LLTVGWPTFAIHDATLVDNTVRKCIRKLRGTHGFRRFLRDGQYTDIESKEERFYQATDMKVSIEIVEKCISILFHFRNLIKTNVNGQCSMQ